MLYSTAQIQLILTARTQLATKPMLPNPSPRDRYIYIFVLKIQNVQLGSISLSQFRNKLCVFYFFKSQETHRSKTSVLTQAFSPFQFKSGT